MRATKTCTHQICHPAEVCLTQQHIQAAQKWAAYELVTHACAQMHGGVEYHVEGATAPPGYHTATGPGSPHSACFAKCRATPLARHLRLCNPPQEPTNVSRTPTLMFLCANHLRCRKSKEAVDGLKR